MSAVAAEAEEEEVALKVAVRLRPKLRREKKEAVFWEVSPEDRRLRCTADKSYRQAGNQRVFQRQHGPYAAVFGPQSRTEHVHADLVRPIVASFLDGYNGCVFAYGQTGSGKTHTLMGMHMHGPDAAVAAAAAAAAEAQAEEAQAEEAPVEEEADRAHNVTNGAERELGVIQRTVVQVLRKMKRDVARRYFLRVSYLEIYNEKLKDLLLGAGDVQGGGKVRDKSRPGGGLSVFDHPVLGPSVKNLTEVPITGIDQLHELIMMGERRRAVGRTNMNEHSSRSHTMFRLVLESAPLDAGSSSNDSNSDSARTESPGDGSGASADQVTVSQLYLVDLAGSENVKKSGVEGKRMREAAHINTSLAQLTLVITQLAERSEWEVGSFRYKQIRIHYRASKLTHVLSGCLGGNARTVLICAVSPAEKSMTETHSTLQFAERAARIVNHVARVKVSADTALIGKHMHDVEALRAALRGDEDEESAALDQERLTLHRRTQDAEAAQALAQAEALEEKQKVAEHRALLQAVSTLNTAFPER
jgi:centromeric protein E